MNLVGHNSARSKGWVRAPLSVFTFSFLCSFSFLATLGLASVFRELAVQTLAPLTKHSFPNEVPHPGGKLCAEHLLLMAGNGDLLPISLDHPLLTLSLGQSLKID